jgi:hypothetical protein
MYTLMMRADGVVIARQAGKNANGNPFGRVYVRRKTPSDFRDMETLRYIADTKGFRLSPLSDREKSTMHSFANGNGNSHANGQMQLGSPIPKYMRDQAFLDAKAITTTFWELI